MARNAEHGIGRNLLVSILVLIAFRSTSADCTPQWLPGDGIPGVMGTVLAELVHDDGSGPALYVAGLFQIAGNQDANFIARWNGSTWASLGTGMNGPVRALAVYNNEVIAGGDFTTAGGVAANSIARWNGSIWQPLGGGLAGGSGIEPGVHGLTVHDGDLIAAGQFSGLAVVARWNGAAWTVIAAFSSSGSYLDPVVRAVTVYNNELIAGGDFIVPGEGAPAALRIAKWNGAGWESVGDGGTGMDNAVYAFAVYDDELIAAGKFRTAGGGTLGGGLLVNHVARFNGSTWASLGTGLGVGFNSNYACYALTVFDNHLIAGGDFHFADGLTVGGIARWDGSSWSHLGANDSYGTVRGLTVFNEDLVVGGEAGQLSFADGSAIGVVRWTGTGWEALGTGMIDTVQTLAAYDGRLVAGGDFASAGSIGARGIASWDGSAWASLGSLRGAVTALAAHGDELIASGVLYPHGDLGFARIARWDGFTWEPLDAGMGGVAYALAEFDGELIAGGQFLKYTNVESWSVARWDGASWQPLGYGLGTYSGTVVRALAVYQGDLIAAGTFTVAGGQPAGNVARWDGTTWAPLGSGTNGAVYALAVYGGDLIAGGIFTAAGGGPATRIARWNGASWQPLGDGLYGFPSLYYGPAVRALTVFGSDLVAGGVFATAGSVPADSIARWDGSTWQALGGGVAGEFSTAGVRALAVFKGELHVGGGFNHAGGQVSAFWAHWGGCPTCDVDLADADDNFLVSGQYIVTEGETITVPFTGSGPGAPQLTATLNGPGSLSLSDGPAPLITTWSWTPTVADAAGGPYTISVTFDRGDGDGTTCAFTIEDVNLAPTTDCIAYASSEDGPSGSDLTVEAESVLGREVTLDAGGSADADGDALSYHWDVSDMDVSLGDADAISTSGLFPIGVTMATLTVTDGRGGVGICDLMVRVQDTTPPDVECTTSLAALWPPNHTMQEVMLTVRATDTCVAPEFVIPIVVTIRSDEPDDAQGGGDGNTAGDVNGSDGYIGPVSIAGLTPVAGEDGTWAVTVLLRAERNGTQDGRKYTIDVTATDTNLNAATASCCVVVPHDHRDGNGN